MKTVDTGPVRDPIANRPVNRWTRIYHERKGAMPPLCVRCGNNPPEPKRTACDACAELHRDRENERYRDTVLGRVRR